MSENNLPAVIESVPLPVPADNKVTEDEAAAACKALGLKPIRVRKLSKSAIVGKFMSQLNAAHVGSGRLLIADKEIEKGIKLCDKFLEDYPHEPDVISSLMKVRLGLTEALLKSAHTMIKVNRDSGAVEEMKPLVPAFAPNQPVQTNVQVNIVAKENPQT
jgi:hypothetical protein